MLRVIETHTNKNGDVVVIDKSGTPEEVAAGDSFWMKRFLAGQMAPEVVSARECCAILSARILDDDKMSEGEIVALARAAQLLGGGTGGCT